METDFLVSLNQLVRKIIRSAREYVRPAAVALAAEYHRDDVGQNARSVIEALRREAEAAAAKAASDVANAIDGEAKRHTRRWAATVAAQAQIDVMHLLRDDDLKEMLSVRSEEFNRLIRNLSNDVLDRIERETLGAIYEGRGNEEIAKRLQEIDGISRRRARLIARDQASKLNGAMNEFRQRQAGVTHYEWRTILDGRERPTHHANNRKVFAWDRPSPITGHPGTQINCRCRAIAVLTDDPEDLEVDPDEPLSDFFVENLQTVRTVAGTPKEPVFGFPSDKISERLAQTIEIKGAIARASKSLTEADAERLVTEIYGFLPKPSDIEALAAGVVSRVVSSRKALLIGAANARLDMIERMLTQAAIDAAAGSGAAPVAAAGLAKKAKVLPRGKYFERSAGEPRPLDDVLQEARDFVRTEGARTGNEWGYLHDDAGRKVMVISSGKPNFIEFSPGLTPELFSSSRVMTFHHNHPASTSLSVADLSAFRFLPGLDTLFAHAADGSIFRVRVAQGLRRTIDTKAQRADRVVTALMRKSLLAGEMRLEDAQALQAHIRNLVMNRLGWIEYTFDLSQAKAKVADGYAVIIEGLVARAAEQVSY